MRSVSLWSLAYLSSLFLLTAAGAQAGEPWKVQGRVVDEAGKPVAEAEVGQFWGANGTGKDKGGKPLDLTKPENVKAFWGRLGQMEPRDAHPAKTDTDGRFSLEISDSHHTVMAMDRPRRKGGLAVLPKGRESQPVEIRLLPLMRVRGAFEGPHAGKRPNWAHVNFMMPDDPTRPLDSTRLAHCGSFEARVEVWLPPGRYWIQAYSMPAEKDIIDGRLVPNQELVLKGDVQDVDLGTMRLSPSGSDLTTRIEKAKADGSWGDYTKHYGEKPPRWHVSDARGVDKGVQLSDFKGKWVLAYFWGFGCVPCLKEGLPKLTRFYEEHAAQRDRFEILSMCLDPEGNLKSMADVERKLEPIIEHVWGGKALPFPVMLDNSLETMEGYGLGGFGSVFLVDPQGNLIEGDETVLAGKLKEREDRPRR